MNRLQMFAAYVMSRPGRGFAFYLASRVLLMVLLAVLLKKGGELVGILVMLFDVGAGWVSANQAYGAVWEARWHEGALRILQRAFHVLPAYSSPLTRQLMVLPEPSKFDPVAKSYDKLKEAHELLSTHMLLHAQLQKGEARLQEIMADFAERSGYEVHGKEESKELKQ